MGLLLALCLWAPEPPLVRLWEASLGYADAPVAADLNGDGRWEIIAATTDRRLVVVDAARGEVLWWKSLAEEVRTRPTLGDVDGDGQVEVAVAMRSGRLALFGADGTLRWERAGLGTLLASPLLASWEGRPALLVASREGKFSWLEPVRGETFGTFQQPAGPVREMALVEGVLYTLGADGTVRAWKAPSGPALWEQPLGGNGRGGLVFGEGPQGPWVLAASREVAAFKADTGKLLWRHPLGEGSEAASGPVVFPLAEEGPIVAAVQSTRGEVFAFSVAKGSLLWHTPLGEVATFATPVVADGDGDGVPEVWLFTPQGSLAALEAKEGRVLWEKPLPRYALGSPLIGDAEGDGRWELFLSCADGVLYAFRVPRGGAVLWAQYGGGEGPQVPHAWEVARALARGEAPWRSQRPFPFPPSPPLPPRTQEPFREPQPLPAPEGFLGRIVGRYYWDGVHRLAWLLPEGWDFAHPPRPPNRPWLLQAQGGTWQAELEYRLLEKPLVDAADEEAHQPHCRWLDGQPWRWRDRGGYRLFYHEETPQGPLYVQAFWFPWREGALILRLKGPEAEASLLQKFALPLLQGLLWEGNSSS